MRELNGNGLAPSIAQAIEEMKAEQGAQFSLDHINLAAEYPAGNCDGSSGTASVTCLAAQKAENTRPQNLAVILASWKACCVKGSRTPLLY